MLEKSVDAEFMVNSKHEWKYEICKVLRSCWRKIYKLLYTKNGQ